MAKYSFCVWSSYLPLCHLEYLSRWGFFSLAFVLLPPLTVGGVWMGVIGLLWFSHFLWLHRPASSSSELRRWGWSRSLSWYIGRSFVAFVAAM
jgi:hypothetical protein